jgi:hypothetical protein
MKEKLKMERNWYFLSISKMENKIYADIRHIVIPSFSDLFYTLSQVTPQF